MPYDAAKLYESLCDWWFRKSRWLRRKGAPTSMEVLRRLESLPFPRNSAEALIWCRLARRQLDSVGKNGEVPWRADLDEKLLRYGERIFESLRREGFEATADWACDQIVAGGVTLEEAVQLAAGERCPKSG